VLETELNKNRNIYLKTKKAGGVKITFQAPPKNLDEKMLFNILREYKMLNCEVLVRDENGMFPPLCGAHYTWIQPLTVDLPFTLFSSNCR
jgi:hypothetical protein